MARVGKGKSTQASPYPSTARWNYAFLSNNRFAFSP